MKMLILGMFIMALLVSLGMNLAFYSGRLTPEQELLQVTSLDRESCAQAQDEVDCLMRVASSTTQQERK
jgi:hypothetical protein